MNMELLSIAVKVIVAVGLFLILCYFYVFADWYRDFNWSLTEQGLEVEYRSEIGVGSRLLLLLGFISIVDAIFFHDIPTTFSFLAIVLSLFLQFTRLFKKSVKFDLRSNNITLVYYRGLYSRSEVFLLNSLSEVNLSRQKRFSSHDGSRLSGLRWVLTLILEDGPDRREIEILAIHSEPNTADALSMLLNLRDNPKVKNFPIKYYRDDLAPNQVFGELDVIYWRKKTSKNMKSISIV